MIHFYSNGVSKKIYEIRAAASYSKQLLLQKLVKENNIGPYCNSFYFQQRQQNCRQTFAAGSYVVLVTKQIDTFKS
jgi:hypothetical protein